MAINEPLKHLHRLYSCGAAHGTWKWSNQKAFSVFKECQCVSLTCCDTEKCCSIADGLQLSWLVIHSPVYTIYTFCTVATWIAVTLIDVDLTVRARGAWLAAALVAINEVLTVSSKLARVALTLVDLCLAQVPSETWVAVACEWVLPIDTLATMTWGALTVIYVCFTVST
jgi:hypothetical protein